MDFVSEMLSPDAKRRREQVQQFVVGGLQDGEALVDGQFLTGEGFLGEVVPAQCLHESSI